ncbi:unnamed protein product [Oncorhynchus mykiss]|uniref:Uncharacterized protein n=1 Tax=Oncorhynchus mykiss TaxID=8022 RepID=A0A060YXF0_ONCMY|nr:unnamed protein product [Oncorhynchus mykiss]
MIQAVNRGNYGWRAANYSQFFGMSLDEGLRYRLGTQRPSRTIMSMNEMQVRRPVCWVGKGLGLVIHGIHLEWHTIL